MKSKASFKTPSQIAICAGLTRYALRATFRNKAGYFFSFIFPLLFVVVFGMFGSSRPSIRLGMARDVNRGSPIYLALQSLSRRPQAPVTLVEAEPGALQEKLRQGRIAAIVGPGAGGPNRVTLVTSDANPQGKAAAESLFSTLLARMNLRAAGITDPTFQIERRVLPGRPGRFIDFILPGQIGFSMLSLATFGIAFNLTTLRKTLVLKRMLATSVRPLTFVVSQGLSRSVQAVLQSALIILIGVVLYHFNLAHGWATFVEMLALAFMGILAFIGYGILMANLATDEHTLPVVLNLFNLPQVLLAGVFFPIDGMPQWVQVIGNNLPLAYLNTSLRKAAGDGVGLLQLWPYLLGMFGWSVVAYVLAARTFKTE